MNVYEKPKELGIALVQVTVPTAVYVPFVRAGNLTFLSGHIACKVGPCVGQRGQMMSMGGGRLKARSIAIEPLGTLHAAVGNVGRIRRIVKPVSPANFTDDFHRTPARQQRRQRTAGRSVRCWGIHARSAISVAQVPTGGMHGD